MSSQVALLPRPRPTPSAVAYVRDIRAFVILFGCLVGCGKPKPAGPPPRAPQSSATSIPIQVRFGDCAAPDAAWVSGPRPQPAADEATTAADEPPAAAGTAMALDEGKMGRADSDGAAVAPEAPPADSASRGVDLTPVVGGVDKPPDATIRTVSFGPPTVQGDLDKAMIRRVVKRDRVKLQQCYAKLLAANPHLAGTLETRFSISPSGTVASSTAKGLDAPLARCVTGVIRGIVFPKPRDGERVTVIFPLTFHPAGGSAPSPAPESEPAAPPDDTTPVVQAPLHTAKPYTPGLNNPLRAEADALTACLRTATTPYGVVIVTLGYGAGSSATSATVDGISDATVQTCIAGAVRRIREPVGAPPAQRCSLAFGDMPANAMPGIEITDDAIRYDGNLVERTPAALHGDGPIAALVAAVTAGRAQASPGDRIVTIRGPLVIRPAGTTPMLVVDRVLASVVAAGGDFVLAAPNGSGWRTLPAIALPVVPVPIGTGGTWQRWKPVGPDEDPEGRVALSILVRKDRIWLGVSRVNDFIELTRGREAHELAQALAKEKAFFEDRTDVEIAGDDDVPYADVVALIDAATTAGFSDWRIASPEALAVRPPK